MGTTIKRVERQKILYNFRGKLDDKNRLTIPADVRADFEGKQLVITPGFEGSLHLYTDNVWEESMMPALSVNPKIDDATPAILNQTLASQADYFLGDLQQATLDPRGRLVLDTELVIMSGLNEVKDWKAVKVPAGNYWRIRRLDRRPQM